VLNCYNEATGKLLWQWKKSCRDDLQADAMNFRFFPKRLGVCSTPAVDGDRLYFVDHNCVVQCLDVNGLPPEVGAAAGQAKVLWSFDMYTLGDKRRRDSINKLNDGTFVGTSEIIATPVFYKDRIYVSIGRDPDHGRGRGALLCLDATQSGDATKTAKIWVYQGLDRTLSTVSIADGLLYVADVAGRVHCLDAEMGHVYWVYESKGRTIASTMVADGKIYLPNERHLDILAAGKTLKLLSQISLGAPSWATPAAANGTLYVASNRYLWAVSR